MEVFPDDARHQPASEQTAQPVLSDDCLRRSDVPDPRLMHLPVRLHNTQRVRHRVRHDRRNEPDERLA